MYYPFALCTSENAALTDLTVSYKKFLTIPQCQFPSAVSISLILMFCPGVVPITDYMGWLWPKGVPFSDWRYCIYKGRDFTSRSMEKGKENCHLGI